MANIIWLESGTSATQDLKFYSSTGGTAPSSVTTPTFSGPRSLACDIGAGSTSTAMRTGVLADAGRRVSFYFRCSALPSSNANIFSPVNAGNTATIFRLQLQTNGKLRFVGSVNGTSGNTVLSANHWYRIAVSYTVTSTTVNRFKCWIQDVDAAAGLPGSPEIDQSNLTLAATGTDRAQLGWSTTPGASGIVAYYQNVYIDDGTDYADPGNIQVTQKDANSGAVYASNANYLTRGTGAINERPPSTTNGQNILSNTDTGEYSTAIQAASAGDIDISGDAYVGSMGWIFASGLGTDQIVFLNTPTVPSPAITSTATVVFIANTSASYPQDGSNRTIGIRRPTGGATDSIYGDGGVLVAYTLTTTVELELTLTDDLNSWGDSLALGYGLSLSDDANNIADAASINLEAGADLTLNLSDDLNNWSDSLSLGPGLLFTDDLNSWADSLLLGYGLSLTDDANNLTDSLALGLGVSLSDDLNSWADSVALEYGLALTDVLDNWIDGLELGYGLDFTDNLNNWLDTVELDLQSTALTKTLSDNLNSWQDALELGYGLLLADDANNLADALAKTLTDALLTLDLSDDLNSWDDSLETGYGLLITDDAASLTDSVSTQLGTNLLTLDLSDDLNTWADTLALGHGLLLTDDVNNLADSLALTLGTNVLTLDLTDDLNTWNDSASVARSANTLTLADDLNNWADQVEISLAAGPNITLQLSDNLNAWQDALAKTLISGSYVSTRITEVRTATITRIEVRTVM